MATKTKAKTTKEKKDFAIATEIALLASAITPNKQSAILKFANDIRKVYTNEKKLPEKLKKYFAKLSEKELIFWAATVASLFATLSITAETKINDPTSQKIYDVMLKNNVFSFNLKKK